MEPEAPQPKVEIDENDQKDVDAEEKTVNENDEIESHQQVKSSFIAMCQRKPELTGRPFLHSWSQRVFGNPLLLRVAELEGYSGRDFYDLVSKRVRSHVPPGVLPFLTQNENNAHTYSQDGGQSGMRRRRQECHKSIAHSEETVFGEIPRYGFRLRITSRDGKKCSVCPWYESCIGSLVPDDDYPTIVADGDTVSIDWHIAVDLVTDSFGRLSSSDSHLDQGIRIPQNVKRHYSCHSDKGGRGITLEECLQEFSKEEKIPEVRQILQLNMI